MEPGRQEERLVQPHLHPVEGDREHPLRGVVEGHRVHHLDEGHDDPECREELCGLPDVRGRPVGLPTGGSGLGRRRRLGGLWCRLALRRSRITRSGHDPSPPRGPRSSRPEVRTKMEDSECTATRVYVGGGS